jgi:hypothetical protein
LLNLDSYYAQNMLQRATNLPVILPLFLSLFWVQNSLGQEAFMPPSAQLITVFPFTQLTGGVIVLRGCIAPYPDSLNFILDTGSGGISLDSAITSQLNIDNVPSDRTIRGIAGMRNVNFAYNRTLLLPGIEVDSLNFHINDYELLSSVYGLRIDGIIGYSFLRRFVVRIDYDKQLLEIYKPGFYKYPKNGHLLRPHIAGLPIQSALLGETRKLSSRFYLDTGAGLCLLLSEEFCADSSIFSSRKKRYQTITEGLGGKKSMDMTVLKEFKIGPYKFKKVPTYIFEDDFNVTSYPSLAGLIGNDLLRRFNVVINYPRGEMHILPNSHYRDNFDYAYTGMGMYTENGEIFISDIIEGSPAALAGLKAGDIVVGIDNNISNNLQEYKGMLLAYIGKIRIIVRRGSELFSTKMTVKSIL